MSFSPQITPNFAGRVQASNSPQLMLRVGQFVTGSVKKILGNNRIMTEIQGQSVVASSQISVNVGETLLMQVKSMRPKPKLRVINQLKDVQTQGKSDTGSMFQKLNGLHIPVTPTLFELLFQGDVNTGLVEEVLRSFERTPDLWRRLLWHATISTADQIQQIIQFSKDTQDIFSTKFIDQYFRTVFADTPMTSFNDLLSYLRNTAELNNQSGRGFPWETLRRLYWDSGYWVGDNFPLRYREHKGLGLFSFWQPEQSGEFDLPIRLTLLGAFQNGWNLHAVVEFRKNDLAGVIDVNDRDLQQKLEQGIPSFRGKLESYGFANTHIRANYTVMDLDISQLFPAVKQEQPYTG